MAKKKKPNATGRSTSEHFIKIICYMYDSDAFQDLTPIARCIILELRRRFNGSNNGEISLSCREVAKKCKCGKGTASNAFKELNEHGFIKVSKKGFFTGREATTWILTFERLNEHPATNEWKQWRSQKQKKVSLNEL